LAGESMLRLHICHYKMILVWASKAKFQQETNGDIKC